MATIGLDKLYYAKITEDSDGNETYDTPIPLAKAMSAELSVELAEATLYADDGASEVVKEFQSGTLTLGIDNIGTAVAEDLTGATIDKNKADKLGKHPWKAEISEDDTGVASDTISGWYTQVYEPTYAE